MKSQSLVVAALLSLLVLAGCKDDKVQLAAAPVSAGNDIHRNWVSIPALPIIQEAVFSLSPTFDGQRNPVLMAQVCGLARGELKQEQVNDFLEKNKIAADKVPKTGAELSLLVNGDKPAQVTACAAYLATSVLSPVDISEFMTRVTPPADAAKGKSDASKAASGNAKGKEGTKERAKVEVARPASEPALQVDPASLSVVLPVKLALARADADVFALIAAELQRRPGLSVAQYRDQARELFTKLAPVYLERIQVQMPGPGAYFRVLRLDADLFAFSSTNGSLFEYAADGLTLRQNSVIWFGQGKLLGQEYPLQVAYFDPSVDKLLAPAK